MEKVPLYFEQDNFLGNGMSWSTAEKIAEKTGGKTKYVYGNQELFSLPCRPRNQDNPYWKRRDSEERYYYPICCTPILSSYKVDDKHSGYTLLKIPGTVQKDCVAGRAKILLYETWEGFAWWYCNIFVNEICSANLRLRPEHFVVVNGNLDTPKNIPFNHIPVMWFQSVQQPGADFEKMHQHILSEAVRPHKFLMMSRRPAPQRLALVYHLWDYLDESAISYDLWEETLGQNTQVVKSSMVRDLGFDPNDGRLQEIIAQLPLRLDQDVDVKTNPVFDTSNQKFYNSYLQVIAETFYGMNLGDDQQMFFSEKTFKPMQYLQPFVLMNYPHSLVTLRSYSYETFSKWINEDYDNNFDLKGRLQGVVDSVHEFCKNTPEQMSTLMKDMLPVLEHNYYQRLKNVTAMDKYLQEQLLEKLYS